MFIKVLVVCHVFLTQLSRLKCDCDMKKFKENGIVPNIISESPQDELKVIYSGRNVTCGEGINITSTTHQPSVIYPATSTDLYALAMFDPDAPEPSNPVFASFLHWLVVNIPGNNIKQGELLAEYKEPSPPPYSEPHRYVFLVFRQPSYISNHSFMVARKKFDVAYMRKAMDSIVAGNFFYAHAKRI